jgi:hypothetical protein
MFRSPVVVVVGAGAGVEYRMPLGIKLATDIADSVRFRFEHYSRQPTKGDPELFNILFRLYQQDRDTLNAYTEAGNQLAAAMSSCLSVDDALYQLSENPTAVTLGKIAIVRTILKAEHSSSIALSNQTGTLGFDSGRDGWIEQLFSMAISDLKKSQISSAFDNITFINFNYDRCIEHYLYWSLQRVGLSEAEAGLTVSGLKMIRPYGSLGSIRPGFPETAAFGGSVDPFKAISRIRTYTESDVLHDGGQLSKALMDAALVMFLGFGFHAQNLKLLELDLKAQNKRVMATVKKVHAANLGEIKYAIARNLTIEQAHVELFDMTAPEMLRELRLKILMQAG